MRSTAKYLPYQLVIIYVLPAIFTAVVAGTGVGEFGYMDTSSAICSISSKDNADIFYFYIPLVVFNAIGFIAGRWAGTSNCSMIDMILYDMICYTNRIMLKVRSGRER